MTQSNCYPRSNFEDFVNCELSFSCRMSGVYRVRVDCVCVVDPITGQEHWQPQQPEPGKYQEQPCQQYYHNEYHEDQHYYK